LFLQVLSDDAPDARPSSSSKEASSSKGTTDPKQAPVAGSAKQPKSHNPRQPPRGGGSAPKKAGPRPDIKRRDSQPPTSGAPAQDVKPVKVSLPVP
jgi:hypothetical protein